MARQMLLTKANRKSLPCLYSQDGKGADAIAQVKFFTPTSSWTWYASEFDGEDLFFGWATDGQGGGELGYFRLSELAAIRGPFGVGVERDMYFDPTPIAEAVAKDA